MKTLAEVVSAILNDEGLVPRQWAVDCARERVRWDLLKKPSEMTGDPLSIAASLVELMAERAGVSSPSWTAEIPGLQEPLYLVPANMKRSRAVAEKEGPMALRRRRIYAMPDYLTYS